MTPSDVDVTAAAHAIQLAVAPVFLLSGVGALLGVGINRLARVVDRARVVEGLCSSGDERGQADARREIDLLARRARFASRAIYAYTTAALLVCLVIATLFLDSLLGTPLRALIEAFFVAAMAALIVGLLSFLREVHLATQTLPTGLPRFDASGPGRGAWRP